MSTSPETIRKAAIVIASLDEASADKLLDSIPEEVASQIRWMSIELDNVTDEERRTVLDEFLRNSGRPLPADDPGVELEFTYEEPLHMATVETSAPTPPPFAFLNDAPSEMLAPFFEQEHPQVTAVVMSYLRPERASEILRQLPARLQADVVHRITQLDEPSQEIVADIESRIKQIVSRQVLAFERRRLGMAAAQAILKASSGDQAEQLLAELRSRGSQLPGELEAMKEIEVERLVSKKPMPQPTAIPFSPVPAKPEPKMEPKIEPIEEAPKLAPKKETTPQEWPQPKFPFERFAVLDDASLAKVLHQAGPKVVLLALCGASPAVMKRISRGLGAGDVKLLERKIREMQPVLLADIDHAKRQMCLAADSLLVASQAHPTSHLQAAA
ncbi:Flagellar motor switch protein FliG [Bremerella volcania]|uniref:Flagellar motor switch protein FliG n=1 Tax=Bremerella volcania TaxID=2527984 RepID=A0A518C5B9_9BACT|nr:FliG C-terminal domain-containing protein [Bremerella volcania]QDU74419.1 Flagellar motor switch protein FliG [Bremerella volcania]